MVSIRISKSPVKNAGKCHEVVRYRMQAKECMLGALKGSNEEYEEVGVRVLTKADTHLSMSRSMLLTVCLLYATLLMFCSRVCHFCLATLGEKVVGETALPTPVNTNIQLLHHIRTHYASLT